MPDPRSLSLGGKVLPLDLDALDLLPVQPGGRLRFDFELRGVRFVVHYEDAPNETFGRLKVAGDCGPMPFTVESPAARSGLTTIVSYANDALGAAFRVVRGRIIMTRETRIDHPLTAANVIGAITMVALPVIPYLELMDLYVSPPLTRQKSGNNAIRPQWRKSRTRPAQAQLPAPK